MSNIDHLLQEITYSRCINITPTCSIREKLSNYKLIESKIHKDVIRLCDFLLKILYNSVYTQCAMLPYSKKLVFINSTILTLIRQIHEIRDT